MIIFIYDGGPSEKRKCNAMKMRDINEIIGKSDLNDDQKNAIFALIDFKWLLWSLM